MRQIKFEQDAFAELEEYVVTHPKTASKILALKKEIAKTPVEGKGKPEPLKHQYKGFWSRKITEEHRLVYAVTEAAILIVARKGLYV